MRATIVAVEESSEGKDTLVTIAVPKGDIRPEHVGFDYFITFHRVGGVIFDEPPSSRSGDG